MITINRITIIVLLIAAVIGAAAAADAKNIRRFAVIVGANNGGSGRVMLRYAVSDADTMMNVLKSIGGVSDNDGLLLVNPDRRNLISAMNKIKNEIDENRQKNERIEFIFYYSGHSDDEAILLGREKIYYKELKEAIRGIPADVRIAILDSCSSGAFTRIKGGKFRPPFILDSSFNMKGDAFMTSSSSNEASQESDAIKGSFFTYYLVSGLRGAADMIQDGRITLNEAYQYAYNETLMRTEKTMGGTQHPNYDIQMTGTGDVVITDIKRKTSGLLIEKKIAGKIYIRSSDNTLIAELQKPYGREMEVALPEGKYSLLNQSDNAIFETQVNIAKEERYILAQNSMTQSSAEETVYRGDQQSAKKQQKKVIIENRNIEHGWYISAADQVSMLNGNWANFAGGKAGWVINHTYCLGAEGYGLVYPSDRDKLTDRDNDSLNTKVNIGYGGVLLEYFIWPEGIITLSAGIMIGGGALEYYNPDHGSSDDADPSPGDSFFVAAPEFGVFINITEYVRIGAGLSYMFINGIEDRDISDRNLSGFSFSIAVAAGVF